MLSIRSAVVVAAALLTSANAFAQTDYAFSAPSYTVREGSSLMVTVVRSGDVSYATSWGLVLLDPGGSFSSGPYFSVQFAAGQQEASTTLSTWNDKEYRGTRSAQIELTYARNGVSKTIRAAITIEEDEPVPTVSIDDVSVREGNGGGVTTFDVTVRCAPQAFGLFIALTTQEQSARAGSDFVSKTTTVQVPPNSSSLNVPFQIVADGEYEPPESFRVIITDSGQPITKSTATITILNDDPAILTEATVERGSSVPVRVEFGDIATVADALTVTADAHVLEVPATVPILAGSDGVTFGAKALNLGGSEIAVQLPGSLGGRQLRATILVVTTVIPSFTPSNLTIPAGRNATATLAITPPQPEAVIVALTPTSGIETLPTAVIPAGGMTTITLRPRTPGIHRVTATVPAQYGATSATLTVAVTAPPQIPTISSITPPNGPTAGGSAVQLSGSRLAGNCVVMFGGIAATGVTIVNTSTMTAITPAHPAGAVDVTLQCDGGDVFSLASAFTFNPAAPTVASVSPSFGSKLGGTLVRVTGTNLHSACGMTFDGALAGGVSIESPTAMIAIAPAHAPGRVHVGVRCDSGDATLDGAYSFVTGEEPAPSISSLSAQKAAPGETITITGARFRPNDSITFGGAHAEILRTTPDAHVVRVPDLIPQTVAITVRDSAGRASTTGAIFDVLTTVFPQIGGIHPATAWPGAEVEVTGVGFRPAQQFFVDFVMAPVIELEYDRVLLRVPGGVRGGTAPIHASGGSPNISPPITLQSSGLTVASASPRCADVAGGMTVTLTGTAFDARAAVTFGGIASPSVTRIDANTLRVVAPANLAGSARIVVTDPSGAIASLTNGFTYLSPMHPDARCGDRRRTVRR